MLEEASEVMVSTLGKPGVRWKFAKKGTLFDKKPDIGQDSIHIFKDFTHVYCDNKNRKSKRKLATIFWIKGQRVQHKLTQKEEAAIVKKFYNDRGRESIDWSEAETLQNRLQDPETGKVYSFLPHSLWKKHLSGSKKKSDNFFVMGSETCEKPKFSFDHDVKMIKKLAKHSVKRSFLADKSARRELLSKLRRMHKTKSGYGEEDEETLVEIRLRRFNHSVNKV